MIIDETATGGDQPETTESTAAPETEKVEAPAKEGETSEAISGEAAKAEPAIKTEAELAAEASEAGKALNKRKQSANERISEITGKYREEQRRADTLALKLAQLEGKLKAPNADEYTDASKLNADQIAYALDQRRVAELKEEHSSATAEADRARAVAWYERVEAFKADAADFDAVALTAPIGKETSLMVADMEDGPAVAYHIGKNPAEARRIDGLPERQRAFALGKIAAQITTTPPKRITAAPTPVNAVSGKSAGGSDDPGAMSMEEYARRRNSGWRG